MKCKLKKYMLTGFLAAMAAFPALADTYHCIQLVDYNFCVVKDDDGNTIGTVLVRRPH